MMSLWTKFRSSLRAFRVAQRGNVAITFALASLPVITGVGFAIDYSHANAVKVALQSALDSTALMLSKEASHRHQHAVVNERHELFPGLVHAAGSHQRQGYRQL